MYKLCRTGCSAIARRRRLTKFRCGHSIVPRSCLTLLLVGLFTGCVTPQSDRAMLPLPSVLSQAPSDIAILSKPHFDSGLPLPTSMRALTGALVTASGYDVGSESHWQSQAILGEYNAALASLLSLIETGKLSRDVATGHLLYLRARVRQVQQSISFESAFKAEFHSTFAGYSNEQAYKARYFTSYSVERGETELRNAIEAFRGKLSIHPQEATSLLSQYYRYVVYHAILPLSMELFESDAQSRYLIDKDVLIQTSQGVTLSAIAARPRNAQGPLPAALIYTIYADEQNNVNRAIHAAAHGYAGVVADARGKRLSQDEIRPYEAEATDVNEVITWVTQQRWSDGRVAMYGGSYEGFAQWAALKSPHPALKTIVPYVAAIPGLGLPMENNIFLNANYGWAFYVTNNRLLDNNVYRDPERWNSLNTNWFESGRSYRELDQVDGTPNPWLHRWLDHAAYDHYWQAMVPYRSDYSAIDIPILSITGYYDDGQISALHYLAQHERYHPDPQHYLVIGPYDHFGAQRLSPRFLRGYEIDSIAQIDTPELTFAWLDFVLKDQPRPAVVKNRINYQLMGHNSWQSTESLQALNVPTRRFYLSNLASGKHHLLSSSAAPPNTYLEQEIDFSKRDAQYNDYYPWPIVKPALEVPNGLAYLSEPLTEDMQLTGRFSGKLDIAINKRDVDVGLVLYEVQPDGSTFHLSYHLGRASFAKDPTNRSLLSPHQIESVPVSHTRMVARRIAKGSRIAVVANVNFNAFAQINYGTGKDVSEESIADATTPLVIRWYTSSFVDLPLRALPPPAGTYQP